MDITVVICTNNRGHILAKALERVGASILPESFSWEVLVVDNNSNDQTRQIVEEISQRYPGRFRYFFEAQMGKSYALNAGVREARGEILAFMDDDVLVESTWLQNLTAELHGAEWAGAGGRTLPEQAIALPRWLSLKGPYALGGYWPRCLTLAMSHSCSIVPPTVPIWLSESRCSRYMGSFAPI